MWPSTIRTLTEPASSNDAQKSVAMTSVAQTIIFIVKFFARCAIGMIYDDEQWPCRRFHGLRRSATRTLELMMVTADDLTCAGPYGETP